MDPIKHRSAAPLAAARDRRAASPAVGTKDTGHSDLRPTPKPSSGVLRELADLARHWD